MPTKVFVFGATGYVGSQVTQALVRRGYLVCALCRTHAQAKSLAAAEVVPVVGDMHEPSTYSEAVAECSVVVHAASDAEEQEKGSHTVLQAICDIVAENPNEVTLISFTGVWVWGNHGFDLIDETTTQDTPAILEWRAEHDRVVLENADLKAGILFALGTVYGRQSSLTSMWFDQANSGDGISVVGDGQNYFPMVHVDDVAAAVLAALDTSLHGPHLYMLASSNERVGAMVDAIARVARCRVEYEEVEEADSAEALLAMNQRVDSRKARRELGWAPRHESFMSHAAVFYDAWRAFNAPVQEIAAVAPAMRGRRDTPTLAASPKRAAQPPVSSAQPSWAPPSPRAAGNSPSKAAAPATSSAPLAQLPATSPADTSSPEPQPTPSLPAVQTTPSSPEAPTTSSAPETHAASSAPETNNNAASSAPETNNNAASSAPETDSNAASSAPDTTSTSPPADTAPSPLADTTPSPPADVSPTPATPPPAATAAAAGTPPTPAAADDERPYVPEGGRAAVEAWTAEEVAAWLQHFPEADGDVVAAFVAGGITGKALLLLSEADLKQDLKIRVGPRKVVYRAIEELNEA